MEQNDEAHLEHLDLKGIKTLADQLYRNRPDNIIIPDYEEPTLLSEETIETMPLNDELKRAVVTDDTLTQIKEYMDLNQIDDFSTAINTLIKKGLGPSSR